MKFFNFSFLGRVSDLKHSHLPTPTPIHLHRRLSSLNNTYENPPTKALECVIGDPLPYNHYFTSQRQRRNSPQLSSVEETAIITTPSCNTRHPGHFSLLA